MNATIAQSREAFVNRQTMGRIVRACGSGCADRPIGLLRASIGALAAVLAMVAVPGLLRPGPSTPASTEQVVDAPVVAPPAAREDTTLSRGNSQLAEAPPADAAPADGGTRMGMVPGCAAPGQTPLQVISTFEGSNVRIGPRLSTMALELYLPDISGEATIDTQAVFAGEEIEVPDAFRMEARNIVAVRVRTDESRFWTIYRPIDGTYTRDMDLSALVPDAADQREVSSRLPAS